MWQDGCWQLLGCEGLPADAAEPAVALDLLNAPWTAPKALLRVDLQERPTDAWAQARAQRELL